MRVPLTGYAPDVDPTTPGIIVDCDAIVPTTQGLAAANALAATGQADLAATPTGSYATVLLDGTKRMFASTGTNIYEASGGAWLDRSRAGLYTGAQRQRFCVFGNNVLSTNRAEVIGQATSGGSFVDIAGAPKAAIIVSVNGFVMAFDTNDGAYGDRPDGWWGSGIRDQTAWTPSAATQAANGRLLESPGRILAAAALGNDVVAYKASSMYLGRYVGGSLIWQWQRIPGDIGCSGAESVVTIDSKQFFIGPSDLFVYDGTVPTSLQAPIREWFFQNLNQTYRSNIIGAVDIPRSLVYWYYPSINSTGGALDMVLTYNIRTNQWGKRALSIAVPVIYTSGQITYANIGTMFATYNDLPSIAYDSPFWLQDQTIPAVFQGAKLYSLTGTPAASWLKTGDYGDPTDYNFLKRVTPRYRTTPVTGTATNYYRDSLGDLFVTDSTAPLSRERFDFRRSARWHSIRLDHTGPAVLDGLDIDMKPVSSE